MANVTFKKGLLANLPAYNAANAGVIYVTTDERAMYLDTETGRIRLGDFQEFSTVATLEANENPSTSALYYVTDINCLAKWNGSAYIQINRDTGFTSFEIVGDGNAVTAIAVDETDARKLIITKGATYATREYVGNIPSGYTETNVVAYINKKAEEVLSQATGGSSESAASVKAALDAYKAENDPKVTQAQTDIDTLEKKVGEKAVGTQISEAIDALDLANTYDAKGAADAVDANLTEEVTRAKTAEAANASAAKAADDKAVAAQADVDTLESKIGVVPEDKTVVGMIAEAQTAATYNDTEVRGLIENNAEAIGVLNGDETTAGSVKKTVADEIAKVIADAPESFDTLKEISDWISSHGEDAAAMNSAILALQGIVAGIGGESDEHKTVVSYINAAIAALNIGDYALAADLTVLANRVAALEGTSHAHDNKTVLDGVTAEKVSAWNAAEGNAKTYADGLNTAMDARVDALESIDHDAYKAYADQAETDAKAYADGLAGNYDAKGAAAQALTDAQAYADAAETDAISSAKSYTDSKLEWGTF